MTTHDLKVWPEFFGPIERAEKLFELRFDDREFEVDDWLRLREWKPADILTGEPAGYTGNRVLRQVSYIVEAEDVRRMAVMGKFIDGSGAPGAPPLGMGWVILGLRQPIVELGVKLQGRRLFLESTKVKEGEEATQYLVDLMQLVEKLKRSRDRRKA